jgi:hypothetical protein
MVKHSKLYAKTLQNLDEQKAAVLDAETKLIEGEEFLVNNATFLVNSFIVLTCTYIETYLKDAFDQCIDKFNQSLDEMQIPSSVIFWATNTENPKKKNTLSGQHFKIEKNSAYIQHIDSISGNIGKTIACFKILDLDLTTSEKFENLKPQIGAFVESRNIIVHSNKNNNPSLSLGDVAKRIDTVKEYLAAIDEVIMSKNYLD